MEKKEGHMWCLLGTCSTIFSWILLLVIGFLVDRARPPMATFLNRVKDLPVRQSWDYSLLEYSFYLMIFLLVFSLLNCLINIIAWKFKKDCLRFSPIILSILSIINIFAYLYNF